MTEEKENSTILDFSTYKTGSMEKEALDGEAEVSEEIKAMYNDTLNLIAAMLTLFTKLTNIKLSSGTILCNSKKQAHSDKYDFSYQVTGNFELL